MIAAKAMMNDDHHRFPEQAVEGEIFDTAPGISSREQGKIVVGHDGRVPHVSNRNRPGISIEADGIVVYGSDEICSFQYSHGRFGKNALGKDHYPVMMQDRWQLHAGPFAQAPVLFLRKDIRNRRFQTLPACARSRAPKLSNIPGFLEKAG